MRRLMRGEEGYSFAFYAIVFTFVLLPLLSLCIDIPRLLWLRSHLQTAADGAAEAAALQVDVAYYQATGDVRFDPPRAFAAALDTFSQATADLPQKGYYCSITNIVLDDEADTVTVEARGTIRFFFGIAPPVGVPITAVSRTRFTRG